MASIKNVNTSTVGATRSLTTMGRFVKAIDRYRIDIMIRCWFFLDNYERDASAFKSALARRYEVVSIPFPTDLSSAAEIKYRILTDYCHALLGDDGVTLHWKGNYELWLRYIVKRIGSIGPLWSEDQKVVRPRAIFRFPITKLRNLSVLERTYLLQALLDIISYGVGWFVILPKEAQALLDTSNGSINSFTDLSKLMRFPLIRI